MAGPLNLDWTFNPTINLQKFNILAQELKNSLGKMGGDVKLLDEAKITAAFQRVDREAGKTGNTIKDSFAKGTDGAGKFNTGLDQIQQKLKSTQTLSEKAFSFAMISQSLGAIGSSMQQLSSSTVALDTGLRNVGTLGVTNWKDFQGLMDGFVKKGNDAAAVTKALYDSISAGTVKSAGGIGDLKGAEAFLGSAAKLAKSGLVDISVTTDALTSVINAYGESAESAGKFSDQLFGAVKLGKTTVAELAPTLYNVVPAAASAGIGFDQVAAGLATITKSGLPTAQATTAMRQAIVEMLKPAGTLASVMSKAGISIETIKTDGLQQSFFKLKDTMQQMGIVANQAFSSVEAANAFNALTVIDQSGAKVALDDLAYMQTQAIGSVDKAYEIAAGSIESKSKRMWGTIQSKINEVMGFIGPQLTSVMNVMPQVASTMTAFAALKFLSPVSGMKSLYSSVLLLGSKSKAIFSTVTSSASLMGTQFTRAAKAWKLAMTFNPGGLKAQIQNIITAVSAMIPAFSGVAVAEGTAAASATTMWAAIGGPITIIIAAIAALGAALFGLHALMGSFRKKSAEENLKVVNNEMNKNEQLKQSYESQLQLEEQRLKRTQDLKKKYEDQSALVLVGGDNLNQKKAILELEQMYPGVVKAGMTYKESLKAIATEEQNAANRITNYKASLYDLQEAQSKLTIKKDNLQAQKQAESLTKLMTKSTQGWFDSAVSWLTGSSAAEQKAVDAMNGFKQGIYKATTENSIKEKVIDFQLAIWQDPRFSKIPDEDKIKMVNSIKKMGEDQAKALKEAQEHVKKFGGKISDYLPKVSEEDAGVFGKAWAWISDTIMSVLQPLIDIFNGINMYIKEFIFWLGKMALDAAWATIKSVFNATVSLFGSLYDAFQAMVNFIKNTFIGVWENLLKVFNAIPGATKFIEKSINFVKSAFNGVLSVVNSAWNAIKGIYESVVDFFNMLRLKGSGEEAAKNGVKVSKEAKDKEAKYNKQIEEQKNKDLKKGLDDKNKLMLTSLQTYIDTADQMTKDELTGGLKIQQGNISKLKAQGVLSVIEARDWNEKLIKAYRSSLKKMRGLGTKEDKEAADKDYNEFEKVQKELSKRKSELSIKGIEDEYFKEKASLDNSYEDKIRDLKERIEKYSSEISKSNNEKLKNDRKQAIEGVKELIKVENTAWDEALEDLYSKLADKRIKENEKVTKEEITALKDKESQIRQIIEESGKNVTSSQIATAQKYQTEILQKETDQRIESIISEQKAYKNLQAQIIANEMIVKGAENGTVNISPQGLEAYKSALLALQTELDTWRNNEQIKNEDILNLKNLFNFKLAELQKKQAYEVQEYEISLIKDSAKQKYEYDLLQAEKTYDDKLSKAKGIQREEMQAWLEFQQEKLKVEQEYALKSSSFWSQNLVTLSDNFKQTMTDLSFEVDDTQQKESLKKIDDEEKALSKSLLARTSEYENYISRLGELDKQRVEEAKKLNLDLLSTILNGVQKSLEQTKKGIEESLKTNIEKYTAFASSEISIENKISEVKKQLNESQLNEAQVFYYKLNELETQKALTFEQSHQIIREAYSQTAMIAGVQMANMLAQQKSFAKASVLALLEAAKAMVPIFIVEILGEEFATKSLLGIGTAAFLSGTLLAALTAAEAGVSKMKFWKGKVDIQGPGTTTSDSIPSDLSRRESVINARGTIKNIPELLWINKTGKNVFDYYLHEEPERIKEAFYSIAEAKDLMKMGPVINLMIEERNKEQVAEIRILQRQNRKLTEKVEKLIAVVEKGNYSRKEYVQTDINLEFSDSEILNRSDRRKLASLRKS